MEGVFLLKKKYRLRKNKDFQKVYGEKNSVAAGTIVLYIRNKSMDASPRVGFSVSKKIGNSVVRNRCRRLMREALRPHLPKIKPGKDYVFIGRHSLAKADFYQVEKDMINALRRKGCIMEALK
ncbi:Ribonuclease P protein component [bioreactor metagenome]|uniref:Ribonuclease P protein component n=1 Tax=bioreactor metagenome TaxID=1076179 RepID=A0A645HPV3_9ZZZZ